MGMTDNRALTMSQVYSPHSFLLRPIRKYCYYPHFTDVVTETQGWNTSPKGLAQACLTPEQPGVPGAWLYPEGTGQQVYSPWRPHAQPSDPWPRPVPPTSLACAELLWHRELRPGSPQWLSPSAGSSFSLPASRATAAHRQPGSRALLSRCCARRKTPIDRGLPRVLPFFPVFLCGQETLWWGRAGCEGDPRLLPRGCVRPKA